MHGEYRKRKTQINIQSSSKSRNDANIPFRMVRAVRAQPLLFGILWLYFVIKMCISLMFIALCLCVHKIKRFLFSLFDLTETVSAVMMIFEGNGIEQMWIEFDQNLWWNSIFTSETRKHKKEEILATCLSRDIWIYNRAEQSQREPFGWACVLVSVNVWRVQRSLSLRMRFPFRMGNFVVRTQFKILSKSRYSLILNKTGPTKSDERQKLRRVVY